MTPLSIAQRKETLLFAINQIADSAQFEAVEKAVRPFLKIDAAPQPDWLQTELLRRAANIENEVLYDWEEVEKELLAEENA